MKKNFLIQLSLIMAIAMTSLWACQKEQISNSSSENDLTIAKKDKCEPPSVDVSGSGIDKKEAKKQLNFKAGLTCYNACKNDTCDDGACAYKSYKLGKIKYKENADGEVTAKTKVECSCKCQTCKKDKPVALVNFPGEGISKEKAVAAAEEKAKAYCKDVECPRFPCEDEEKCMFVEAKIETITCDGEEKTWTAEVSLKSCECECKEE